MILRQQNIETDHFLIIILNNITNLLYCWKVFVDMQYFQCGTKESMKYPNMNSDSHAHLCPGRVLTLRWSRFPG